MTSTLMQASATYDTMPKSKRILAAIMAIVLAISMVPFAHAEKAYAADAIATSAGSATVTRTIEFVYEGESTAIKTLQESHTFTWGKGANLSTYTTEFPQNNSADYWTSYPSTWSFSPATIPAKTVSAEQARNGANFTERVVIKGQNSTQTGTAIIKFVDVSRNNADISSLTVTNATAGSSFSQKFSSGTYAGKSLVEAVQETIDQLSNNYNLVENPINNKGTYQAGTTEYLVKMTPKQQAANENVDTSVTVKFIDQYDNDIALNGYLAQISTNGSSTLNGKNFSDVTYSSSNGQTLNQMVAEKVSALEGTGYSVISNDYPDNGVYGPTAQVFTVHMHKPSIEDGQVTPPANVYYNGSSQKPEPIVMVDGKTLVSGTDYLVVYPGETWTLGNETIEAAGDTVNAGIKEVQIIGWGNYSGYRTTTSYQILPLALSASLSQTDFTYNGKVQRPAVTVVDANGNAVASNAYTITWQNADSVEAGSYTVAVAANAENGNYEGSANLVYNITAAPATDTTTEVTTPTTPSNASDTNSTDIKNVTVSNPASTKYNGKKQTPSITVTDGSKTLKEGTDYSISWSPSGLTNAGTYTGTITGKGTYTGSRTVSYTITKVKVTKPQVNTGLVYNGKAQEGVKPAKAATGCMYGNNLATQTNAGDYTTTATLTNTANYEWSDGTTAPITLKWSIAKAKVTPPKASDKNYNGSNQRGVPEPAADANYSIGGTGSAWKAGTYTTTARLKSSNYQWSDGTTADKSYTWKINPARLTSVTAPDQTYDGKAKTPTLIVKSNAVGNNIDIVTTSGYNNSAYEIVKWENNKNAGTAKVTIRGKESK